MKPNERPSTKLDTLKKENKNLIQLLETSKQQLKECIENSKKEKSKLIDELISIFESRKDNKDAISVTLKFLNLMKGKSGVHSSPVKKPKKSKDYIRVTEENFDSKVSNEYFSKNYCYKCATKPSVSENYHSDEAQKLKELQAKIDALEQDYLCLETKLNTSENKANSLILLNEELALKIKEKEATIQAILKLFSRGKPLYSNTLILFSRDNS